MELAGVDLLPQGLVVTVEGVHQVLAAAAGGEYLVRDAGEELQPVARAPGKRLLAAGSELAVAEREPEQIAADVGRERRDSIVAAPLGVCDLLGRAGALLLERRDLRA